MVLAMPPSSTPRASRVAWLLVALGVFSGGVLTYEVATWPDVGAVRHQNPRTTAFIEREKAKARREGKPEKVAWTWVPYSAISANLKCAVLVGEDIGFFSHHGFETYEIGESLREAWDERELPRGASTLTQQVAKNLWLSPSRNPLRKAKEAILTWQLERHLGKRRILEIYLNVAEFGPGIYGAEAASRRFFGLPAAALDERQAAELAAGLPRPSSWHPGVLTPGYRRRVASLERKMDVASWLRRLI